MLLDELHRHKDTIEKLATFYGARKIRVFGSVARQEERPDSDVDFLVDFPPGYDMFHQRMPLMEQLEALTGRPVDVIPEHELNHHFRDRILQEAKDL